MRHLVRSMAPRLVRRVLISPVAARRKRRDVVTLSDPVVGSDGVYLGDEEADNVRVDRERLEITWRTPSKRFLPIRLWKEQLLLVGEAGGRVGMLDLGASHVLWTRPSVNGGGTLWRDWFVIETRAGLEFLDPRSGDVHHCYPLKGGPPASQLPEACDRFLYLAREDRTVRCLDLASGRQLWERNLQAEMAERLGPSSEFRAHAFVLGSDGTRFIATYGEGTFGCSMEDGRILWQAPVAVANYAPNVLDGRVYAKSWGFVAMDESTGAVLYDRRYEELSLMTRVGPGTLWGDWAVYPSESGHFAVFNLKDGELIALPHYPASLWRSAVADDRLLLPAGDGHLLVYEKAPLPEGATAEGLGSGRTPLKPEEEEFLAKGRELVQARLTEKYGAECRLTGGKDDLAILQRAMNDRIFKRKETLAFRSLGVVFGDVFAKELGFSWVRDPGGPDPALSTADGKRILFPVTMVMKRVVTGELLDLPRLFVMIASDMQA